MRRPLALDGESLDVFEARFDDLGFDIALWIEASECFAWYGLQVIGSWTASGEIFAVLVKRGIRYQGSADPGQHPTMDDAMEIANETVARGLVRLREILETQGWSADGGARLRTFFITQCLFQFPNVYRRWRRECRVLESPWDGVIEDPPRTIMDDDPADRVIAQRQAVDHLRDLPDDRLRFAVQMRAEGYGLAEVATMLGVLPKTLENALGRYRRKNRNRHPDHDRETLQ